METLNLSKSYDFFKPEEVNERIHILGCGSIGSTVAELLARFGLTKLTLYDFDKVEPKNLANQMFRQEHVGMEKVKALAQMLCEINPQIKNEIKVALHGYVAQKLSGYIFLCVDSIDLRRKIATNNKDNPYIKAMFDFRTRLTDAQHYAAEWNNTVMVDDFIRSMNFTHEEAKEETPVSACNVTLSVAPTIRIISALGVTNFVNFTKDAELKKFIQIDAFSYMLDAF
jgi:molybdopterin/thiamine biosynthesis adenylyltransferase